MYGCNMGAGGWVAMIVAPVLVIGLIIVGIVLVMRLSGTGGGHPGPQFSSALAILEERFARGEIDEEEFARRRDALSRR